MSRWIGHLLFVVLLPVLVSGCEPNTAVPEFLPSEGLPGGGSTVATQPFASYMRPAKNLAEDKVLAFHAGKALAHQPWVKAPTATVARDGLGPLYNARTCLACHVNGGRGRMPDSGDTMLFHAFVRISVPGSDERRGVVPEPTYGDQIQTQSIALYHQLRHKMAVENRRNDDVAPEAYVYVDWQETLFIYPDGDKVVLRFPTLRIENLGYGELAENTLMGIRNAPPIHGMGLLELIDQRDIDRRADPNDMDKDGISGRVNYVWDTTSEMIVAGRFGLKANRPNNIALVTAAAFANDVGITNPIFPLQPCTEAQDKCNASYTGNNAEGVELSEKMLQSVADFSRNLGVPKRHNVQRESLLQGRRLFYEVGCHGCHTPSYVTQSSKKMPHLAQQTIWPYTDLLLHDMGPGLADGRPDFMASGSEWRTPPLWGIAINNAVNGHQNFLHDGRARSIEEAVLWHGGEAETVKHRFATLNSEQRELLLEFVESL
ncbi:MAG: thiol oxidoreductase [Pseudomonadales bacterium]|nr:thiol oxidoreductase [Pseudomonadales bacterium]